MVACNEVGAQPGLSLGGHSSVIDPLGTVVARAAEDETILYAQVDPGASVAWREQFPALQDIRIS
jgi:predicted amidohydrolase